MCSGVTTEGEGVKVESSACYVASTPEVAGQNVTKLLYSFCFGGYLFNVRLRTKSYTQLTGNFWDTNNEQFDMASFCHQSFYVTSLHYEKLYIYLLFLKKLWFQALLSADEYDDDDVDLFGEETEEEVQQLSKLLAEERLYVCPWFIWFPAQYLT